MSIVTEKDNTRLSKFLSLVLRHQPEVAGIVLDENGWTDVEILLTRLNEHGFTISRGDLDVAVSTDAKRRFAYNKTHTHIRASQGHSVTVDLAYEPTAPPSVLYHGTAETSVDSILNEGLQRRERNHVHLSADTETARKVGMRYGKPVILKIAAHQMFRDGYDFFKSENDVWLTNHVPVKYLSLL